MMLSIQITLYYKEKILTQFDQIIVKIARIMRNNPNPKKVSNSMTTFHLERAKIRSLFFSNCTGKKVSAKVLDIVSMYGTIINEKQTIINPEIKLKSVLVSIWFLVLRDYKKLLIKKMPGLSVKIAIGV